MLDWEQRVVDWRRLLAEHIGPDPNILDELESHLRDEIDRLVQQGQTPDHAVLAAIARVGTPEKLAVEFAKVARPWWPIRFVLAGTCLAIGGALVLIGLRAAQAPWDGWLLSHVAAVTVGYLLTYSIGMLALCYALRNMIRQLSAGQRTSWSRALARLNLAAFALTLTGFVLGGVWAEKHWGRFWDWDLRASGALLTLGWQAILLLSLWCCVHKTRWLMCWGLLGNVTVTFAWFVTNVLVREGQLHSYGIHGETVLILFWCIMVTHLLLMAGGIAPSGWLRIRKTTA